MFQVSKEFAPPFALVSPFFKIGSLFYMVSLLILPFFNTNISYLDLSLIAWVHLFLLGFIMMVIFGAMAQLIPVVLEVGHFSIDFYYLIWPMLTVGTILMALGFSISTAILPYGGLIVLLSMLIFLADTALTLKRVKINSLTSKTIKVSTLFLAIGILIGFLMTLTISSGYGADIDKWLGAHIVTLLVGFVLLTIIGISMVLLPMFGLSHGFNDSFSKLSFKIITYGVSFYILGSFFSSDSIKFLSFITIIVGSAIYLWQIWLIYKTRGRKENEIWFNSIAAGYLFFIFAVVLAPIAVIGRIENFAIASGWFLIVGFFTFLINGHLFKIVPFLVWFEKYSPLVGKEKVPMLADMIPKKAANFQFWLSFIGTFIAGVGILLNSNDLFKAGAASMAVGGVFLYYSVKWMINFSVKREEYERYRFKRASF